MNNQRDVSTYVARKENEIQQCSQLSPHYDNNFILQWHAPTRAHTDYFRISVT